VRRLLATLMLLLVAGTLIPATSASAGVRPASDPGWQRFGVRLYDVPVPDLHNPRGLRYIIDFLPSGTVIHRRILVLNEESRTVHLTVYPDAAAISGGEFIGQTGQTRSELTSWIRVQHASLTLRPQASILDMVTIRVPRSATRGEHYGEIWVQQSVRGRTSGGVAVTEVARVGIRIYLAVGRGGAPPTNFAITSLTGHRSASGGPLLIAHVRNTGGRAVDLSGQARLSAGSGGVTAGPFREQQILTLAPGQSANMVFTPGQQLPSGPWHATVAVVSGFTHRTARSTIRFLPGRRLTVATWTRSVMIWAAGLAGVTLASLVLALILLRGRGQRIPRAHARRPGRQRTFH
jgi:hypothetical protein